MKTLSIGLAFGATLSSEAFRFLCASPEECAIIGGCQHLALPNQIIALPEKPRLNETVTLIIEADTLKSPAKIRYKNHPLEGDREDLILDSFGLFSLTFKGQKSGWILS